MAERTVESLTVDTADLYVVEKAADCATALPGKAGRLGDPPRLPEMAAFVGGGEGEQGAERHPPPGEHRRGDARARQVEPVGLPQAIDELHLVGAERRHHLVSRPARRRLKVLR